MAFAAVVGLIWLPKDLEDSKQAMESWQENLAMIDQNIALWVFSSVLVIILVWSETKAYLKDRKQLAKIKLVVNLEESDRTQFTIWEAACVATDTPINEYENSPNAQSKAQEMLYYAKEGLIRPSFMTDAQYEAMKFGKEIEGYNRDKVTLDSHISKKELWGFMQPGWETWLPILDEQRKRSL